MIKKSLLILISLFILLSCSNKVISPLESEEVLIEKYGIDISQKDIEIRNQIEQKLKAYFQEKGSYRVIFTGTPKEVYDNKESGNQSLYVLTLEAASKLNITMDIELDLKNINFQDGSVKAYMFSSFVDKYKNIKIRTIEKSAFNALYNTKEITLPDSVIAIKEGAFTYSPSIERVTLGNGLQEIATLAFMGLDNLKEITIPDSVKSIGTQAFALSPQLTTLTYLGTNPNNINYEQDVFLGSTKLTTLIVPNAINEHDSAWKTFLGGKFTTVTKGL